MATYEDGYLQISIPKETFKEITYQFIIEPTKQLILYMRNKRISTSGQIELDIMSVILQDRTIHHENATLNFEEKKRNTTSVIKKIKKKIIFMVVHILD